MRCPFCASEDTQVKDSRATEDGASIRRRRFCNNCGSRFTTFERVQLKELSVVKKDGAKSIFNRNKIVASISIAVRKRPITEDQVEMAVNKIVNKLEKSSDGEVTSKQIGKAVMETLADLDPVAYIRFASVYKDFRNIEDFQEFASTIGVIAKDDN